MKKIYLTTTTLFALILFMASSIDHPLEITITQENILNDTLILDLPDDPMDYYIDFPDHLIEFGMEWGNEPIDPEAINDEIEDYATTLGRVLFYDTKMSSMGETSCATCHLQEFSFASNKALDLGENGILLARNTPNINDLAWAISDHLFWDLREDTLENMVLQPILNPDELNGDLDLIIQEMEETDHYPSLFEDAFGTTEITTERMANALSQFIRSMSSFNSKFDQALITGDISNFTPEELNGQVIFQLDCETCHFSPHFAASPFPFGNFLFPFVMNNGLDAECEDPGAGAIFNTPEMDCVFRSPSMKNIEATAPYMHDGRFATLDDVINFYSDEVQEHPNSFFQWTNDPDDPTLPFTGFNYTDTEKAELKAFLLTLTDYDFLENEKWSNPFKAVVTATNTPEKLTGVIVRPNPSSGNFLIEFENTKREQHTIKLTTVNGKVVLNDQTSSNRFRIHKKSLAKGIYMLHIFNKTQMTTEKIVVR